MRCSPQLLVALTLMLFVSKLNAQGLVATQLEGLVHPDASIRKESRRTLVSAGEIVAGELTEMVKNADLDRAVSAAIVLAEIGTSARETAWNHVLAVLENPESEDWRWSVAAALVDEVNPSWATEANPDKERLQRLFVAGLQHSSPMVQYACVQAVSRLGSEADIDPAPLLALLKTRTGTFTEFNLHPRGDDLVVAFQSPFRDDFVILHALHQVGLDPDELRPLWAERTEDRFRDFVRLAAAESLAGLGDDGRQMAIAPIRKMLEDPFCGVRREAAKLAGNLQTDNQETALSLLAPLRSEDEELRYAAAEALLAMSPVSDSVRSTVKQRLSQAHSLELLRGPVGQATADKINDAIQANP